jgi:vacuolar-type H+-ATPase catalytic subunit A/Vma1
MKALITFAILLFLYGCNSPDRDPSAGKVISAIDTNPTINTKNTTPISTKDNWEFEKKIYLKIDKIYTGKVYTNKKGIDVFYRILFISEEENTMIQVENISIGEEGGNYKLLKRFKLTNKDNGIDSLKFIDTVNVEAYSNNKKMLINLDKASKPR